MTIHLPSMKAFRKRVLGQASEAQSSGFTLIEAMISVLIVGLIIAAISLFFTRGIAINRETYEQVLTTEEARLEIDRVADVLRNARGADGEAWLVAASDNEITVYSNTDDDSDSEKVRYILEGDMLKRGVTQPGAEESVQVLATHVRNAQESRPMFTYYDSNGAAVVAADATVASVQRIGIAFLIDINEQQKPGSTEISTIVTPRAALGFPSTRARLWPVSLLYPHSTDALTQDVTVTLTDPASAASTQWFPWVTDLGDGRLTTYDGHYYVNINYQAVTVGSFLPGWYAWIGPIRVGQSGQQVYYQVDQVPIDQVCQGQDLDQLLVSCPTRTVYRGTFSVTYKPIIIHTWPLPGGFADFVREIKFAPAP